MTAVLYISTGIALYGAVQSLHWATRVPSARVPVNILFALLCLSVASFAASSAWLQSVPPVYMPLIGKIVITCGLLSWFILTWLATLLFQPQQRWLMIGLTVAWSGLGLLNLSVPGSLVYFNFTSGMPSFAGPDSGARLSQGWVLVHLVIAVSWCLMLWCTRQAAPRVRPGMLTGWWVALALLGGATGMDLLVSAGLLSSAYLSPFAWTLLLMLVAKLLQEPAALQIALDQRESPGKVDMPQTTNTAVLPRTTHDHTYLPIADPASTLHFHWHLDPARPEWSQPAQDFKAPRQSDNQAVAVVPASNQTPPGNAKPAVAETVPQPLENDLAAIVQFTRIALRRIERGKTDATKFATLFRAIQQKAEAARDTLVLIPARENIYSLVANVLLQVDSALQANDIRVVQRLDKDLPATGVDQVVLEQVLSELLHEAIESTLAMPREQRTPIVLNGCVTEDEGIELSIADGGTEVSAAEIQNTFESLLAESSAEEELPLIAAAGLIESQGGRLWCAPNPAGGTIRHLRLPGASM